MPPGIPGAAAMARLLARVRSLWRGLRHRTDVESEMAEEFRHHLELRTEDLMRQGLPPREAARQARLEFGHSETHKQQARAARGLRLFDRIGFSWLDLKLGVRMLVKHPVLTVVTGLALAVGIPLALAPIHFLSAIQEPPPVPDGDRIHLLRYVDVRTSRTESPSLRDFVRLREELTTFEALGQARERRDRQTSVVFQDGGTPVVRWAEVTASTFDVLRVPPLLGRSFTSADGASGAAPVVIIGYDLWESGLGRDPDLGGRTLRIAGETYSVVGVMPEGFRFPYQAQLWLPVEPDALASADGQVSSYWTLGRLSDGVTLEQAEAELATVIGRMGADFPETHAQLRPYVMPLAPALAGLPRGGLRSSPELWLLPALTLLVLAVACTNVAMLMLARTASRLAELTVRTALGASRLRIITQLFTEALVLAVLATGAGLFVAKEVLARFLLSSPDLNPFGAMPYWIDLRIAPTTVFQGLGLAVFSAAVVGVLPALKVTGKAVQRNIQEAMSRRSGVRFGRLSSALLVVDVAAAVVLIGLVTATSMPTLLSGVGTDLSIPDDEMLAATLTISRFGALDEPDPAEFEARLGETQRELVRRLEAEPGVRGVAVASDLPHELHSDRWIEVEGVDLSADSRGHLLEIGYVDPAFFEALGQPILAGRGFELADLGEDRSAVIVNTMFVDQVLGSRNPIGRRVRYESRGDEPGPWYEIVGVVGDLGMNDMKNFDQGMYHPAAPGEIHPLRLAIHVGDDPVSFTPRLRGLATDVDPAAMISDTRALSDVQHAGVQFRVRMGLFWGTVAAILFGLAASGIYALMSLSVTERTREVGIRRALGARRSSVAFTISRRALAQLGTGALVGTLLTGWFWHNLAQHGDIAGWGDPLGSSAAALLLGVSVLCLIGAVACTSPLLRALRIAPTEALRVE